MAIHEETNKAPGRARSRRNWIVLALAVAVGLVVLIGAVTMRSATPAPATGLDQVADDYFATWTDVDSDAFLDLVTDDYVFEWGSQTWTAEEKMTEIRWYEFANFRVEFTSGRLWSGDEPRFFMSQSHSNYTDSGFPGPDGNDTISVLEIANRGGEYLVARHTLYG